MNPNYEGYEKEFSTPSQLDDYRKMLLAKTAEQSDFISGLLTGGRVLELGCGNGRLLVDLALKGQITDGVGVDMAQSRIDFAVKWAADLGLTHTRFVKDDIQNVDQSTGYHGFDLVLCITGAFQYFDRTTAYDVLDIMFGQAETCVLELYNIPIDRMWKLQIGGGTLKEWDVLPPEDPYAYYLNNYVYDKDERMMVHDKVFIHRTGRIDDGRTETLYYYDPAEIVCVMHDVGYKDVKIYSDWKGSVDDRMVDQMIIVGKV